MVEANPTLTNLAIIPTLKKVPTYQTSYPKFRDRRRLREREKRAVTTIKGEEKKNQEKYNSVQPSHDATLFNGRSGRVRRCEGGVGDEDRRIVDKPGNGLIEVMS